MKSLQKIAVVFLCLAILGGGLALVQPRPVFADNNARDYIPAPAGILAILTYYEHVSATTLYGRGYRQATDIGFNGNIGILRVIYYADLPTPFGPIRCSPQFLVPFGSTKLDLTGRSASGLADPFILSQFWLYRNDQSKTYFAFTPFFFFPLGQYNNHKQVLPGAINLGTNRWQFRQELNFTQGFEVIPGHNAYFEVTLGLDEYTSNKKFGAAYGLGNSTLKQDPLFTVESHVSYDITKSVFASLDYYGHFGGKWKVEPVSIPFINTIHGSVGRNSLGVSLAYSFAPGFQLMLQYRGDVSVENGPRLNIFLARFLWATDTGSLTGAK